MIFDSDILIWATRGNDRAVDALAAAERRRISVITCLELLQGARDARDMKAIKAFLSEFGFETLPLTENIGHRAMIYIEQFALSTGMDVGDALVAATVAEANEPLLTGNDRHYRAIKELELHIFRP